MNAQPFENRPLRPVRPAARGVRTVVFGLLLALALCGTRPAHADLLGRQHHYAEGVRHFKAARYEEALRSFEAAYQALPDPLLLANMGAAQLLLGRTEEALESYQHYLQLVPSPDEATGKLLGVYLDQARARVERDLKAGTAQPRVLLRLAQLEQRTGHHRRAVFLLVSGLRQVPGPGPELGSQMAAALREALAGFPGDGSSADVLLLVEARLLLAEPREALTVLATFLGGDAVLGPGERPELEREVQGARELARQAVVAGGDPGLLLAVARVDLLLRRGDEALAAYRQYLAARPHPDAEVAAQVRGGTEEACALVRQQPERTRLPDACVVPPPPRPVAARPFYRRFWFWGTVGLVAAGTVAVVLGTQLSKPTLSCGDQCPTPLLSVRF